jgi:hypothetical protein
MATSTNTRASSAAEGPSHLPRPKSNPTLKGERASKKKEPFDPAELTRRLEFFQFEKQFRKRKQNNSLAERPATALFATDALAKSLEYHQNLERETALKRRSAGDVDQARPKTSGAPMPFEADLLVKKLEAYQRSLEASKRNSEKVDSATGVPSSRSNSKTSDGGTKKEKHRQKESSIRPVPARAVTPDAALSVVKDDSALFQPRSAHTAFMQTTTRKSKEELNAQLALGSANDNSPDKRQSENPVNQNPSLNDQLMALLSSKRPNSMSLDHAIKNGSSTNTADVAATSPEEPILPRTSNDRPNWAQQDEKRMSHHGSQAVAHATLKDHVSLRRKSSKPRTALSTVEQHRDAAITAQNDAARRRHSKHMRSDEALRISNNATNEQDAKENPKRKSYQEVVKKQRRISGHAKSNSKKLTTSELQDVTAFQTNFQNRPDDFRRVSSHGIPTPEPLDLVQEQERRLADLRRRQVEAEERYTHERTKINGNETEGTPSEAFSNLGEGLAGLSPENLRLLRERQKLVRWRAEKEKAEFEQRQQREQQNSTLEGHISQPTKIPDAVDLASQPKGKRRSKLLCCFQG